MRLSPGRVAEISIGRKKINAPAGPDHGLVVQAIGKAQPGSEKAEVFIHHALLRILGRVGEIDSAQDRLAIQRDSFRLQVPD